MEMDLQGASETTQLSDSPNIRISLDTDHANAIWSHHTDMANDHHDEDGYIAQQDNRADSICWSAETWGMIASRPDNIHLSLVLSKTP
jgi:hypothetical protein